MFSVGMSAGNLNEVEEDNRPEMSTNAIVGHPESDALNASITDVKRNVTITRSSRVILEDRITLTIHDNETFIGVFNYSIPTSFENHVVKAVFHARSRVDTGIENPKYAREAIKFIGNEVTTYSFPIDSNGTLANNTEVTHVRVRLETVQLLSFETVESFQRASFISPILPTFPNLPVENNLVGIYIGTNKDRFNMELIDKITVDGNEYPLLKGSNNNLLEWVNISRNAFDPDLGFEEGYDVAKIVFDSSEVTGEEDQGGDFAVAPFIITNADRWLKIDPWGVVYVEETITVKGLGAEKSDDANRLDLNHQIAGFEFAVDKNAKVTSVSDDLGSLNLKESQPDNDYIPRQNIQLGFLVVPVVFRHPIYGGETYTFTAKYQMNATDVIAVEGNEYTLNTTMFSIFNTTILNLNSVYELPAGAKFVSHDFRSTSHSSIVSISTYDERSTLSYFKHIEMELSIINATYTDNRQFTITYEYSTVGIGHLQYILTFVLTFIALLGLFYMFSQYNFYKDSKTVQIEKGKIPIQEIDTFIKYFMDKSDANALINELTEQRRRNKLSQKDYNGKVRAVRKRIADGVSDLERSIKDLSTKGAKYDRLVSRIMIADQKINDVRTNSNNTRKQYAKKAIAKDIYQKIMREYRIEIEKQESSINRALSELRDLIN